MIVLLQANTAAALISQVGEQVVHAFVIGGADDFTPMAGLHYQTRLSQLAQMMGEGRSRLLQQALQLADVQPIVTGLHQQSKQPQAGGITQCSQSAHDVLFGDRMIHGSIK